MKNVDGSSGQQEDMSSIQSRDSRQSSRGSRSRGRGGRHAGHGNRDGQTYNNPAHDSQTTRRHVGRPSTQRSAKRHPRRSDWYDEPMTSSSSDDDGEDPGVRESKQCESSRGHVFATPWQSAFNSGSTATATRSSAQPRPSSSAASALSTLSSPPPQSSIGAANDDDSDDSDDAGFLKVSPALAKRLEEHKNHLTQQLFGVADVSAASSSHATTGAILASRASNPASRQHAVNAARGKISMGKGAAHVSAPRDRMVYDASSGKLYRAPHPSSVSTPDLDIVTGLRHAAAAPGLVHDQCLETVRVSSSQQGASAKDSTCFTNTAATISTPSLIQHRKHNQCAVTSLSATSSFGRRSRPAWREVASLSRMSRPRLMSMNLLSRSDELWLARGISPQTAAAGPLAFCPVSSVLAVAQTGQSASFFVDDGPSGGAGKGGCLRSAIVRVDGVLGDQPHNCACEGVPRTLLGSRSTCAHVDYPLSVWSTRRCQRQRRGNTDADTRVLSCIIDSDRPATASGGSHESFRMTIAPSSRLVEHCPVHSRRCRPGCGLASGAIPRLRRQVLHPTTVGPSHSLRTSVDGTVSSATISSLHLLSFFDVSSAARAAAHFELKDVTDEARSRMLTIRTTLGNEEGPGCVEIIPMQHQTIARHRILAHHTAVAAASALRGSTTNNTGPCGPRTQGQSVASPLVLSSSSTSSHHTRLRSPYPSLLQRERARHGNMDSTNEIRQHHLRQPTPPSTSLTSSSAPTFTPTPVPSSANRTNGSARQRENELAADTIAAAEVFAEHTVAALQREAQLQRSAPAYARVGDSHEDDDGFEDCEYDNNNDALELDFGNNASDETDVASEDELSQSRWGNTATRRTPPDSLKISRSSVYASDPCPVLRAGRMGGKVALGISKGVVLVDVETGTRFDVATGMSDVFAVKFDSQGQCLFTGHRDGSVRLFDIRERRQDHVHEDHRRRSRLDQGLGLASSLTPNHPCTPTRRPAGDSSASALHQVRGKRQFAAAEAQAGQYHQSMLGSTRAGPNPSAVYRHHWTIPSPDCWDDTDFDYEDDYLAGVSPYPTCGRRREDNCHAYLYDDWMPPNRLHSSYVNRLTCSEETLSLLFDVSPSALFTHQLDDRLATHRRTAIGSADSIGAAGLPPSHRGPVFADGRGLETVWRVTDMVAAEAEAERDMRDRAVRIATDFISMRARQLSSLPLHETIAGAGAWTTRGCVASKGVSVTSATSSYLDTYPFTSASLWSLSEYPWKHFDSVPYARRAATVGVAAPVVGTLGSSVCWMHVLSRRHTGGGGGGGGEGGESYSKSGPGKGKGEGWVSDSAYIIVTTMDGTAGLLDVRMSVTSREAAAMIAAMPSLAQGSKRESPYLPKQVQNPKSAMSRGGDQRQDKHYFHYNTKASLSASTSLSQGRSGSFSTDAAVGSAAAVNEELGLARNKSCILSYRGHTNRFAWLRGCVTEDESTLILGGADGVIRAWEVWTGALLNEIVVAETVTMPPTGATTISTKKATTSTAGGTAPSDILVMRTRNSSSSSSSNSMSLSSLSASLSSSTSGPARTATLPQTPAPCTSRQSSAASTLVAAEDCVAFTIINHSRTSASSQRADSSSSSSTTARTPERPARALPIPSGLLIHARGGWSQDASSVMPEVTTSTSSTLSQTLPTANRIPSVSAIGVELVRASLRRIEQEDDCKVGLPASTSSLSQDYPSDPAAADARMAAEAVPFAAAMVAVHSAMADSSELSASASLTPFSPSHSYAGVLPATQIVHLFGALPATRQHQPPDTRVNLPPVPSLGTRPLPRQSASIDPLFDTRFEADAMDDDASSSTSTSTSTTTSTSASSRVSMTSVFSSADAVGMEPLAPVSSVVWSERHQGVFFSRDRRTQTNGGGVGFISMGSLLP